MTPRHTEADARIAIDDRLRQAGWDPLDKSMVGRVDEFTAGYFDVVITEECHRSIYGAW